MTANQIVGWGNNVSTDKIFSMFYFLTQKDLKNEGVSVHHFWICPHFLLSNGKQLQHTLLLLRIKPQYNVFFKVSRVILSY